MTTSADSSGGITQLGDVDPVIHAPARLMIVTALFVVEGADFVFLQKQTGLTRGNLSSHLMKLEEAHYVAVEKKFVNRTPRTVSRLSAQAHMTPHVASGVGIIVVTVNESSALPMLVALNL